MNNNQVICKILDMVKNPLKIANINIDREYLRELINRYCQDFPEFKLRESGALRADNGKKKGWYNLIQFLHKLHGLLRCLMPDYITRDNDRKKMIISIISAAKHLLWINSGSLNKKIYGKHGTIKALENLIQERNDIPIIVTFCPEDDWWKESKFLKILSEHNNSLILKLATRMEVHPSLAIGEWELVKQIIRICVLEVNHSSRQRIRLTLDVCATKPAEFVLAIIMNHLLKVKFAVIEKL